METLFNNKQFMKASIIFVVLLSLLTLASFINEIKESQYVGRGVQPPNVISVSGTGEVTAVADIATLSLNLSKDGTTSKEAQNLLNEQITKTLAYIKEQKIEDKDIKSEYGGVNPKYSYQTIACITYPCVQPDPKIVGYTASQVITVKVRAVDSANDVRTGLAGLGIKDITGPTFMIDNEESLQDEARSKAIENAREKAKKLARDLDVHLGTVVTFSENNSGMYPMMYKAMDAMAGREASSLPAPVLPKGENKITSSVTVTYEIK